jgi:DEAD/DEAH box helicase domain-containing protein
MPMAEISPIAQLSVSLGYNWCLMGVVEALASLRLNRDFMSQVVAWERLPARPARYVATAVALHPLLAQAMAERGVERLFSHQAAAVEAVLRGENVVVATATASGKSLCYHLPVLQTLLTQPHSRALYLFPTKALAHDQEAELNSLTQAANLPVDVHSYDGDTPRSQRSRIPRAGGILISNPDMMHSGILPYHPRWRGLFGQLAYVVVDELHTYRGVFGSHVANLLRRLQRICRFYGAEPQFICTSATIANPQEHAERLVERPFTLIDERQNGAPTGEKQVILYNPPLVDELLGLRRSALLSARDAAAVFLRHRVQTVVFGRTRQSVELLLTYLQDELGPEHIAGYRGGYLPHERREIEAGLRHGRIQGVVATNALELGVDIGQLQAAVLTGYPGSIASTWQQAGRAGRREAASAVVLVASANPLDQYICRHPGFLFGQSPEHALINSNNTHIMLNHLQCAAFELPFQQDEAYGGYGPVDDLLKTLSDAGVIHRSRDQYHWLGEGAPSHAVSLRTGGSETVIIQDNSGPQPEVIGQVELESAPLLVHEGAIYLHQARAFLVERLDWDGRLAQTRSIDTDYYTRATLSSQIRHLAAEEEVDLGDFSQAYGDLTVVTQATGYRKIKRYSHETLGYGLIDLPPLTLETTGYWLIFSAELAERLMAANILLRPNDYGPNWSQQRQLALARDQYRCRTCGATGNSPAEPDAELAEASAPVTNSLRPRSPLLHVHHIRPFRDYGYQPGQNEQYLVANQLDNLITLCPACHRRAEAGQQARSALGGLAYLLGNLAPLFLMCDPADIQVTAEQQNPITQRPTLVIYERVAAGVGFSQRLFALYQELLRGALELVRGCPCREGCPACVGPTTEVGPETKEATRQLLSILLKAVKNVWRET